jgi:hypothetical protein
VIVAKVNYGNLKIHLFGEGATTAMDGGSVGFAGATNRPIYIAALTIRLAMQKNALRIMPLTPFFATPVE